MRLREWIVRCGGLFIVILVVQARPVPGWAVRQMAPGEIPPPPVTYSNPPACDPSDANCQGSSANAVNNGVGAPIPLAKPAAPAVPEVPKEAPARGGKMVAFLLAVGLIGVVLFSCYNYPTWKKRLSGGTRSG